MADVLEKFDGVKKNGSTDVSSRRNDLDQNWKSFSELLQETQLRLRATHMQLKVRTCGMHHEESKYHSVNRSKATIRLL